MSDVEEQQAQEPGMMARIREHLSEEVTVAWGDLVLILGCFITGLLDAAVFNIWSCFVSMQTGNTIYVGLGVTGQPKESPWRWAKSGAAIISFVLGAFMFSRVMRLLGPLCRGTLVLSFVAQAVLTYISAALVTTGVVPDDAGFLLPDNFIVLLPLCLLSLQSAGQIVVSRILGYGEVTTVVLTSAYCDLAFDEKVLTAPLKHNVKRNRRALSVVMLMLGAVLGGYLTSDKDISVVLWTAGSIKMGIAALWLFWKSEAGVHLN